MANNTSLYGSNGNVLPAGDNIIITGTLTVNGCAILTDCSTFNLLPFNATTVNVGGSATTLALGATTGVTTIQNQLATANYDFPVADGTANQVLITDGAGNLSFASAASIGVVTSITGTANQVIASSPTGAVTLSLPQDIATTSNVTFGDVAVNGGDITTTSLTANIFTTTATQINIGTAGDGTQANGGVIDLGISGQTWNVDVNALLTQNGTTTQATGNYNNIAQTTPYLIMITTRKSMKGFVTVEDNVTGEVHSIEYLALSRRPTNDAYITIYAEIFSDAPLATFTVTETGTGLFLYATPLSANSTDISIMRHSLHD
jgi:hypothetical protein